MTQTTLTRRRLLGGLAATPFAGLLAGCGSLVPGQGPPPDLYRLAPAHDLPADLPKVSWQLLVDVPSAPAGLDTTRIALMRRPIQVQYYAKSNWIDRVPLMVQTLLVETFQGSGKILSVASNSADLRPDFVLGTQIRDFQTEYFSGANPKAHVGIVARLVTLRQRAIIGSKRFDGDAPAAADDMGAIVAAFNTALGQVLDGIAAWTLREGEANRPAA